MTSKFIIIGTDNSGEEFPHEGFFTEAEAREWVFEGECTDVIRLDYCHETGRLEASRSVFLDMLPSGDFDTVTHNGYEPFTPPVFENGGV